jgi:hypothetical protein
MKTKKIPAAHKRPPTADEVRDYAYHLYVQGGSRDGHDLDDWLEAEGSLCSGPAPESAHRRVALSAKAH